MGTGARHPAVARTAVLNNKNPLVIASDVVVGAMRADQSPIPVQHW